MSSFIAELIDVTIPKRKRQYRTSYNIDPKNGIGPSCTIYKRNAAFSYTLAVDRL